LPVDYTYEDIKISGVIGKPEIARSNRANQLFFVNKRYIKDKTLSVATEQAFKGLIPIGRYGFVILNIEMNPAKVDVNVHPAKLEVRFEEENKIFQAIYHSIKDILLKSELVANTEKQEDETQEEKTESLFDFRKNETKKIEKYNDEESKIKTNINVGQGGPINTADILEQLKKMRADLEKQIGENTNIKLNSNFMKIENEESKSKIEETKGLESIIKLEENEIEGIQKIIDTEEIKQQVGMEETEKIEEIKEIGKIEEVEQEEINEIGKIEEVEQEGINEIGKIEEIEQEGIKEIEKIEEVEQEERNEIGKIEEIEQEERNEIGKIEEVEQEEIKEIEKIEQQEEKKEEKDIEYTEKDEDIQIAENKLKEVQEQIDKLENIDYDIASAENFDEMYAKLFGKKPISTINTENVEEKEQNTAIDILKDNISVFEEEEQYEKPNYKFIGIVFKTYIIIEIDKEMYILDQHAAHERIMYEKVKKNYYSDTTKDSQMLLLPDIITLTHKEMDIAKENMEMFEKAGFCLEEFGENTIKLTGVPTVCIDIDNKYLFLETLDEINTVARTAKQEKEEKFIATIACKAAVKANMVLAQEEVESLMDKLFELPNPFTCPHGRPTAIKMTKFDIEKKFARK